jgi:hypothetical protein
MRIRLGRTLRLVIALAFLVLMIPFLMFKLESSTNESVSENMKFVDPEVNIENMASYSLIDLCSMLFRIERKTLLLKTFENLWIDYKMSVYNQS